MEPVIIPHGSEVHGKVLNLLTSFIKDGRAAISNRVEKWNEAENNKKAYVNLSDKDKKRKIDARKGKAGYPGIAPIVVPITFAMNQATLSYLISIFASRNPMVPIAPGGGSDDTDGAMKMESVLGHQMGEIQYYLKLYTWLQDMLDYGVGVSYNYWKVDKHKQIIDTSKMGIPGFMKSMGFSVPFKRGVEEIIGYEGNDMEVIDPYNLIIDSRFPISQFTKGEFFGFDIPITVIDLKEKADKGEVFNIDNVVTGTNIGKTNNTIASNRSKRNDTTNMNDKGNVTQGMGAGNLTRIFVKFVPSKYGVTQSTNIEFWEFWVYDDAVIIYAAPLQSILNTFPTSVIEYIPDGHSILNQGMNEMLGGLQNHLSWLFNSHMENVRKVLNDMLIVDPSRVNINDLKEPEPGKLVRLKETAAGQDVRTVVHQLQIHDVTQGHFDNASVLIDLMQRVSAATDNIQGFPNFGRRTATEINNISAMSGGRMKTLAELAHAQGIKPQHRQFIANTQQFLSMERGYKIIGDNPYPGDGMEKVINVHPSDILGNFDIPPIDGVIPADRLGMASLWKELLIGIAGSEVLMQSNRFNIVGMFEHFARLSGAKDISKFINQSDPVADMLASMGGPGVLPDEEIQQGVQSGNMVALEEILGGQRG